MCAVNLSLFGFLLAPGILKQLQLLSCKYGQRLQRKAHLVKQLQLLMLLSQAVCTFKLLRLLLPFAQLGCCSCYKDRLEPLAKLPDEHCFSWLQLLARGLRCLAILVPSTCCTLHQSIHRRELISVPVDHGEYEHTCYAGCVQAACCLDSISTLVMMSLPHDNQLS